MRSAVAMGQWDAKHQLRVAIHSVRHEVQRDAKALHHMASLEKEPRKVASRVSGFVMPAASAIGTATMFVAEADQWAARHLALEDVAEQREARSLAVMAKPSTKGMAKAPLVVEVVAGHGCAETVASRTAPITRCVVAVVQ